MSEDPTNPLQAALDRETQMRREAERKAANLDKIPTPIMAIDKDFQHHLHEQPRSVHLRHGTRAHCGHEVLRLLQYRAVQNRKLRLLPRHEG
jgi:hypothetical protein